MTNVKPIRPADRPRRDPRPLPASLPPHERLLTLEQILERVPKSVSTIYRWMDRGIFPRSRQIVPGSVVWLESEFLAWLHNLPPTAPKTGSRMGSHDQQAA